jgi:predicted DNA-binding transcriptional regulator AlpA
MKTGKREPNRESEDLILLGAVRDIVWGVSYSTLRRWWLKDPPLFPRPVRLGPRRIAWNRLSILTWCSERPLIARRGYGAAAARDAGASNTVMVAKGGES